MADGNYFGVKPLTSEHGKYVELVLISVNGRLEISRRLTLNKLAWNIWRVPNNASK
jgi:hypothetical protein